MRPRAAELDDAAAMRRAGPELLSLALIDARNHTLRWLAAFDARDALLRSEGGAAPLLLAARAGAWQDRWIARNVRRQCGEAAEPSAQRLPPADPAIDAWLAGQAPPPSAQALRGWLAATLETTLDLLAAAHPDDAGLFVFRCALRHEDRLGEALAERAAELQLHAGGEPPLPWRDPPARAAAAALWLPGQRLMLGSAPGGGAVPENERWAHAVVVPDFEIDAVPVSWAQYAEFAADGGYDRRDCWSEAGWAWLQAEGRRAPRHVEQLRGGVYVQRHGQLCRAGATQAALHLARHEAEAWCRWAGRRLPTEPEWELAALHGGGAFAWGDVFEWVAGSARAWPGRTAGASALDALPAPGSAGVLRGASWMTRRRQVHPKARRFMPAQLDTAFCGFRSCAV
ncbi:SUMF1/EgtB/PvdO family nonheme iron enzyme [Rubrivivax gelatinosus]|uniref:Sulfatase-modifying factor enzyme-like domain-containing protein n=1 Tax=Rubrivivax gelatinosus TaxID=28068 RepID=A0ABS1E0K8_RUBGE|nr:hypothetical protein [Rubrivivax gelatinosus]